jgi:hypothetical protein
VFDLVEGLKVPGRKAKAYEQTFVRTMFWEKKDPPKKIIDGKEYEFSTAANIDCFNCKEKLVEITNFCGEFKMDNELTPDSYNGYKKELIKHCKDWDKMYLKHMKSIYPEMNTIHMACMKPLNQLIDANSNLHKLEQMIA